MRGVGAILLVAIGVGAIASFVTSNRPDALQHFLESTEGRGVREVGPSSETPEVAESAWEATSIQSILAGVLGTAGTFAVLFLVSRLLLRCNRGSKQCTT